MEKEIKITRKNLVELCVLFWQYHVKYNVNATYGYGNHEMENYEFQKRNISLMCEIKNLLNTHRDIAKAEGKYARRIKVKIENPALYKWLTKKGKIFRKKYIWR